MCTDSSGSCRSWAQLPLHRKNQRQPVRPSKGNRTKQQARKANPDEQTARWPWHDARSGADEWILIAAISEPHYATTVARTDLPCCARQEQPAVPINRAMPLTAEGRRHPLCPEALLLITLALPGAHVSAETAFAEYGVGNIVQSSTKEGACQFPAATRDGTHMNTELADNHGMVFQHQPVGTVPGNDQTAFMPTTEEQTTAIQKKGGTGVPAMPHELTTWQHRR